MALTPPPGVVVPPSDIDRGFSDGTLFSHSAFRLELLDEYDAPRTRVRVAQFLAGEPDDPDVRRHWDAVIRDALSAGKAMQRVHVVTEPLTDYLRFEFNFYRGSVAAGEDIRILRSGVAATLDLPDFDYWLFDDERAAVMYYGERGAWQRTEIITAPGFLAACRLWRGEALRRAIPLTDYMARSVT